MSGKRTEVGVRVLYFAWLRQRTGTAEETVEPEAGIATLRQLETWLAARHPRFGEALASPGLVRCAVNQEHVEDDVALGPADEVAFFPPITGG